MRVREPFLSRITQPLRRFFASRSIKQFSTEVSVGWMTVLLALEQGPDSGERLVRVSICARDGTTNRHTFSLDEFREFENAMRQVQLVARGVVEPPATVNAPDGLVARLWMLSGPKLRTTYKASISPFAITLKQGDDPDATEVWMTFDRGFYTLVLSLDELDEIRGNARSILQTSEVVVP